jgi:hypothetical protein
MRHRAESSVNAVNAGSAGSADSAGSAENAENAERQTPSVYRTQFTRRLEPWSLISVVITALGGSLEFAVPVRVANKMLTLTLKELEEF